MHTGAKPAFRSPSLESPTQQQLDVRHQFGVELKDCSNPTHQSGEGDNLSQFPYIVYFIFNKEVLSAGEIHRWNGFARQVLSVYHFISPAFSTPSSY